MLTTTCAARRRGRRRTAPSPVPRTARSRRSAACTARAPRRGNAAVPVRRDRGPAGSCAGQHRPQEHAAGDQRAEHEDRSPAEQGVEDAADQRRLPSAAHHHRGHQPDHGGGVLAVVEIADDGAADGLAAAGAERLHQPATIRSRCRRRRSAVEAMVASASLARITGRRPKRSDSGSNTSCASASPIR